MEPAVPAVVGLVRSAECIRWLWSPADERFHVLEENSVGSEIAVTRCGQELSGIMTLSSRAPSMTICPRCGVDAAVPPPEHANNPESMPP
ncbi:MAG: hypothetical protein ACRDTG_03990 [Pseudonocardiaceae bacterium]